MKYLLRLALVPVLASLAFTQTDEDGWQNLDHATVKFSIPDLNGGKLSEKALEGKVVVIDFWATWCGPCVQEFPELAKFAESIKGRKDVAFLSFSVDDDKSDVLKFLRDRKESFPVYLASTIADRMNVTVFPTTLIIDGRKDKPARIRYKKEGVIEAGEIESRVAELLKRP